MPIDRVIGRRDGLLIRLQQRQRDQLRPGEAPERIGLVRPVQKPHRPGIAVEVMFRLNVVADDLLDGIGRRGRRLCSWGWLFCAHNVREGSLQSGRTESKRANAHTHHDCEWQEISE